MFQLFPTKFHPIRYKIDRIKEGELYQLPSKKRKGKGHQKEKVKK